MFLTWCSSQIDVSLAEIIRTLQWKRHQLESVLPSNKSETETNLQWIFRGCVKGKKPMISTV